MVGDVKATGYGLVYKPCGVKQNGKQEAISQLREEQKRRKADKDDPTYAPEVPRRKNSNKKPDTASNKKSAGDCVFDVSFVFLFFSIPIHKIVYYLISFEPIIHFIFPIWFHSLIHIEQFNYWFSRWSCY